MKAKSIMFLGTGSNVGKSVLAAAFCRILKQDGFNVAPFKAQNMALNSFITPEGGEMGRAQVMQAEAAGIEPHVDMNPILLKPTSQKGAQVIVRGKVLGNFTARDYYRHKKWLLAIVRESFENLASRYDVVVLEGAGGAVELNLKKHDIVNLTMAEIADAKCLLIGDIDRGGIFASLLGTLMLMSPKEQRRTIGFIVNKFRGDPELFSEGIKILESRGRRPVLGIVPYFEDIALAEEDSVPLEQKMINREPEKNDNKLLIGVVRLPFISNYTDFDCFEHEPGVELIYFQHPSHIFKFDAVIIPGSKNTLEDLEFLWQKGLAEALIAYAKAGGVVIGLCGGYQILGERIRDPLGLEGTRAESNGLGLLPMETDILPDKITTQVEATIIPGRLFRSSTQAGNPDLEKETIFGYEIHMGRSRSLNNKVRSCFQIIRRNNQTVTEEEGLVQSHGRIWGTYIHGIFDNDPFRRRFLVWLKELRGKTQMINRGEFSFSRWKEDQYNRLADHVRRHIDIGRIYNLAGLR